MRRVRVVACLLAAGLVATTTVTVSGAASLYPPPVTLQQCTKIVKTEVMTKGILTIATDNPVLAPWFEKNTPTNHSGFEDVLAYDLAKELGFAAKQVKWVVEPYADSYQPGTKKFDFDINEIVYNAKLTSDVSFSISYYDVQQSLIAMKSDRIVTAHNPTQLRHYHYGALAKSPAATYVTTKIKPIAKLQTFSSLSLAETALETGTIDALAIDTPTGNHEVTWDIVSATGTSLAAQFGQFPNDSDEYYALLTQLHNPIVGCLNVGIRTLVNNGTVSRLKKRWLQIYLKVPVIRP
jgi:polar amino acid transport system substrate-binding protein